MERLIFAVVRGLWILVKRKSDCKGSFMIGVLTHHWTNKIDIERGKTLLNSNGLAQSKAPGFVKIPQKSPHWFYGIVRPSTNAGNLVPNVHV